MKIHHAKMQGQGLMTTQLLLRWIRENFDPSIREQVYQKDEKLVQARRLKMRQRKLEEVKFLSKKPYEEINRFVDVNIEDVTNFFYQTTKNYLEL